MKVFVRQIYVIAESAEQLVKTTEEMFPQGEGKFPIEGNPLPWLIIPEPQEADASFTSDGSLQWEYAPKKSPEVPAIKDFVCYFHFIGWMHWSLGFHVYTPEPNIEIHLPFGYIRVGWVSRYGRNGSQKTRSFGYGSL
jgi:hypothetical protein